MEGAASIFFVYKIRIFGAPLFLITPLYFRKIPISGPNYQTCIL